MSTKQLLLGIGRAARNTELSKQAEREGKHMRTSILGLAVLGAFILLAPGATAQTARDVKGATPLLTIENEPPAKLFVDPPLAEPLSQGLVFIQYRTENLRVVSVFGKGALEVSPRIGHLHLTVDDNPWHFVDASGETVIVVGLAPGPHKVLFELADPTHRVMTSQTVAFVVPDRAKASR
jgi:hypothetical protein